jgi:hypothetical protein
MTKISTSALVQIGHVAVKYNGQVVWQGPIANLNPCKFYDELVVNVIDYAELKAKLRAKDQ